MRCDLRVDSTQWRPLRNHRFWGTVANMFERYTEKARRCIFFARYEASQFGSPYIETEYLLLGLLREDKALVYRFLGSHSVVESIRRKIERSSTPREKILTSVDLPLSQQCKRVLAHGAEESERLNHQHIDTDHLLLGLLREEGCFAAQLLREQGLTPDLVREQIQKPQTSAVQDGSASIARLDRWLAEIAARGGIRIVKQKDAANRTSHFALYTRDEPKEYEEGQELTPAEKIAQIQIRIDVIAEEMERAIANHEFEKSRFYSNEERKEQRNLRDLCEQFEWEEPSPRVPFLCIDIIRDERFSEVQKRCDEHIGDGVPQVWLLDLNAKRAYTVTKTEGLREFKGGVLQIANPPLEMDLSKIFE